MTAPGRQAITWRFTFCDLATRRPLARLPLVGADMQEVIGGPASGSGTVPLIDSEVRAADPWTATAQRRSIMFAQRVITRDGVEVAHPALWAGIVWKRVRAGTGLALTMATPESYWGMRKPAVDRTFVDEDDAVIQRQILGDALAVPGGGIGGLLMDDHLVGSRSDHAVAVADDDSVLDVVTAVADAAPLEWRIVPGYHEPTRQFTLTLVQAARLGSTDPGALVWTSDPGSQQANEVLGYEVTEDGTAVPNELTATTTADEVTLRSTVTSGEVPAGWPLLQANGSADTKGITSQTRLDRLTAAELDALRRDETRLTGLTVRGDRGPTVDSYGLGDTVTLRARDLRWPDLPALQYHELSGRVLGRRIAPGGTGRSEQVTMTLGVT